MTALLAGPVPQSDAMSSSNNFLTIKLNAEDGAGCGAIVSQAGSVPAVDAEAAGRSRAAAAERERLRRMVRRVTCSEPWAEAALREAIDQGIRGSRGDVAGVLAARGIYPPPADTTPMLPCRCELCRARRRYWPAVLIGSRGVCLECAYESADEAAMAALPGTVSTVDLGRVRQGHRVRKW